MRIWSLHPGYLDSKGLVALWRETLLAKKVLEGKTKGYKNHPQLIRFRATKDQLKAINTYLDKVADEADNRHYKFDRTKIRKTGREIKIKVTIGQIKYEFTHLINKLRKRDPQRFEKIKNIKKIKLHPMFKIQAGKVEEWEKL